MHVFFLKVFKDVRCTINSRPCKSSKKTLKATKVPQHFLWWVRMNSWPQLYLFTQLHVSGSEQLLRKIKQGKEKPTGRTFWTQQTVPHKTNSNNNRQSHQTCSLSKEQEWMPWAILQILYPVHSSKALVASSLPHSPYLGRNLTQDLWKNVRWMGLNTNITAHFIWRADVGSGNCFGYQLSKTSRVCQGLCVITKHLHLVLLFFSPRMLEQNSCNTISC